MKNKRHNITITMPCVDFNLLNKQKETLVRLSWGISGNLSKKEKEHIEGLLNFLDHFQDECAEQLGEKIVFGKEFNNENS